MNIAKTAMLAATATIMSVMGSAGAATYPTEQVRLVIPYTPGGGADTLGRLVAGQMESTLGVAVVPENKPGANTMVATDYVAHQKNNGYTLLYASSSFTINPHVYKTRYDPEETFEPVAILSEIPLIMVTSKDSPITSVADLMDRARKSPGQISYGSYGAGSAAHLAGALFETMTGLKLLHIPYKGSAPAVNDLMGNHVDIAIVSLEAARELVIAGEVRPLGIFNEERLSSLADIPTVSESVPGCVTVGWNGILAPKGTSQEIIAKLNSSANAALTSPKLVTHLAKQGLEPNPRTPEAFSKIILAEDEKWARVVKEANINLK